MSSNKKIPDSTTSGSVPLESHAIYQLLGDDHPVCIATQEDKKPLFSMTFDDSHGRKANTLTHRTPSEIAELGHGIGVVPRNLGDGTTVIGFDWDKARNPDTGDLYPEVEEQLEFFSCCQIEETQSRKGLRAWLRVPSSQVTAHAKRKLTVVDNSGVTDANGNPVPNCELEIFTCGEPSNTGELTGSNYAISYGLPYQGEQSTDVAEMTRAYLDFNDHYDIERSHEESKSKGELTSNVATVARDKATGEFIRLEKETSHVVEGFAVKVEGPATADEVVLDLVESYLSSIQLSDGRNNAVNSISYELFRHYSGLGFDSEIKSMILDKVGSLGMIGKNGSGDVFTEQEAEAAIASGQRAGERQESKKIVRGSDKFMASFAYGTKDAPSEVQRLFDAKNMGSCVWGMSDSSAEEAIEDLMKMLSRANDDSDTRTEEEVAADELDAKLETEEALEAYFNKKYGVAPKGFSKFARTAEKTVPIIVGVLNSMCSLVIAGVSKVGKTTIGCELAASLVTGKDFLNWRLFPIRDGARKVLFMSAESSSDQQRACIKRAIESKGFDPDSAEINDRLHIWPVVKPVSYQSFITDLRLYLKRKEIKVLILDPLYYLLGTSDREREVIEAKLGPIRELCNELGVTPVFIDHLNKSSSHRNDEGSETRAPNEHDLSGNGIGAWARNMMLIKHTKANPDFSQGKLSLWMNLSGQGVWNRGGDYKFDLQTFDPDAEVGDDFDLDTVTRHIVSNQLAPSDLIESEEDRQAREQAEAAMQREKKRNLLESIKSTTFQLIEAAVFDKLKGMDGKTEKDIDLPRSTLKSNRYPKGYGVADKVISELQECAPEDGLLGYGEYELVNVLGKKLVVPWDTANKLYLKKLNQDASLARERAAQRTEPFGVTNEEVSSHFKNLTGKEITSEQLRDARQCIDYIMNIASHSQLAGHLNGLKEDRAVYRLIAMKFWAPAVADSDRISL